YALLENDVSIEPCFACLNNCGTSTGSLIKSEALQREKSLAGFVAGDDLCKEAVDGFAPIRLADDFHAEGGLVDEFIERHEREDGIQNIRGGNAIEADSFRAE